METTWLNYADQVYKVLTNPLSSYKSLMADHVYAAFEKSRQHGQGSTWYSQNMTKEAAVYIMSWGAITSGEISLAKTIAADAKNGYHWTPEEKDAELARVINHACAPWKDKMPKILSVLNPANGERFLPACRAIAARLRSSTEKDGPQIGLDRVRMFSGAVVTAECRCKLLEAHYGSDAERTKYCHPRSNGESSIRQWLQ